jgi:hypothetical protein
MKAGVDRGLDLATCLSPRVGIRTASTIESSDGISRRACFVGLRESPKCLPATPIRGVSQALLAVAHVAEQPPDSPPARLLERTSWESALPSAPGACSAWQRCNASTCSARVLSCSSWRPTDERNGDEPQLCNGRALAADGAASKQLDACKHQSDRSGHPLMLGTHVRASSARTAAVILTSWSVSQSRTQPSGLTLGGDHEPARRPHGADAHRDRFEHAAAQKLPGAAGEVHERRGREPVADRPAALQDHHGAGEPRPHEGGVELLRDLVEQRAVGVLVEEHLAQAAELGGE